MEWSNYVTKDEIKDCLAMWQKERDNIAMKFQGVRPSYVSTVLAIMEERINRYTAQLKELGE